MIIIPINMLMMIISIHKNFPFDDSYGPWQRQAAAPGFFRRSASARMGERPGTETRP